jgi:hypothetical protein
MPIKIKLMPFENHTVLHLSDEEKKKQKKLIKKINKFQNKFQNEFQNELQLITKIELYNKNKDIFVNEHK